MIKDRYLPFLQNILTPRRLDHSLGVMQVMGELAQVYNLDKEQSLSVGILHDAAKDLSPHQQKHLLEEGAIPIRHDCENDYVHYLHAPVGAYFVQKELGVSDELVLDAIATHCFFGDSRHFDHPLCWCMRFADVLETDAQLVR